VTDAQASYDENGRPQVNIRRDAQGSDWRTRATRNNVGRSRAVVLIEQRPQTRYVKRMVDGVEQEERIETFQEEKKIISLATIQSPLGSQFRITGLDGQGESSELALLLRAGGLAAPMYFAEERTIGPSLGAENITLGVQAALWGFLFVAIFMVLIYKVFGLLATVALLFNMVVLMALMSLLGATLTLPGIAGIVLTMGMAVDANVLIFSRIREEIQNGMSVQRAIHEGFDRALSAIVDGNLTTLLVGGILFAMGTGPIKGFAVTLSLGILTSMFTAVIVTRAMVNLIYGGRDLKKLWSQLASTMKRVIHFMAVRHLAFVLTMLLTVASLASLTVKGLNFGLAFTGGTLVEPTHENPVPLDQIRVQLTESGFENALVQSFGATTDVL